MYWTNPERTVIHRNGDVFTEFLRFTHASPPLSNPSCNGDFSIQNVVKNIEHLIAEKPRDTHIVNNL